MFIENTQLRKYIIIISIEMNAIFLIFNFVTSIHWYSHMFWAISICCQVVV